MSISPIFCVQDRSGTAAQLVLQGPTTEPIEVGDTGVYNGVDYKGAALALTFTVGAVNDAENICITTIKPDGTPGDVTLSNWPLSGHITWVTGGNVASSPDSTVVIRKYAANAYTTVQFFFDYHNSRGNLYPASPEDAVTRAIVMGSDYIDQRYRYRGVKLLQYIAQNGGIDPMFTYIDPWLSPMMTAGGVGYAGSPSLLQGAATSQHTQWPRQGVVDFNGDSVYGVPQVVMEAVCEAGIRVLNGGVLQPDYDPDLVGNGGIVQSLSTEVGPIKESRTFDTKLGIGFFPDFPQIKRMLSRAGVLMSGTGRTITR